MNVAFGLFVPAAVSLAIVYICRRCLPHPAMPRYALAIAVTAGFLAGFAMVRPWGDWLPSRHRDWIPYLALGTAAVAPIGFARGVFTPERWMLSLVLAIVSACLLVPQWESLQPTRYLHVAFLGLYLFVFLIGLPSLADQLSTRKLLAILTAVAVVLAVMVLVSVSALYAQTCGLVVTAMIGCCLSSWWDDDPMLGRGLTPVFAILAGGLAYVAYVEPEPPLMGLLVLAAAPLAIWPTRILPSPTSSHLANLVPLLAVALALGVGVGWILLDT